MKISQKKSFKDLTTFHIGGKIQYYAEPKNKKEVEEAVCFAKSNKLPIFIIGGGSDFLAGDKEFAGMVIKYSGKKLFIGHDGMITAEAGLEWDKLVDFAVKNDLQGIECLSGIPGTVGASPVQNIGAYGTEIKNTFYKLTAYDIEKEKFVEFDKNNCQFGYRESIFKQKSHWQKFIITDVTLKLQKNTKPIVTYESLDNYLQSIGNSNPTLVDVRNAVLTIRSKIFHSPKLIGNAGSFFVSPVVDKKELDRIQKTYPDVKFYEVDGKFKLPAGWLIEKAGWKGKAYKEAGVSPNHALVLINRNNKAKASEILELAQKIIDDVYKKFGVKLEREVQLVNFNE